MKKANIYFLGVLMTFLSCSSDEDDFIVDEGCISDYEISIFPENQNLSKTSYVNYMQNSGSSVITLSNDVYVKVESDEPEILTPGASNIYNFTYYANGTTTSRQAIFSPIYGLMFVPEWTCTGDQFRWKSFWGCSVRKFGTMTDSFAGIVVTSLRPDYVLGVIGSVCLLEEFGVHLPQGHRLYHLNNLNKSGLDLMTSYGIMVDSGLSTPEELLEEILVKLEEESKLFGGYLSAREFHHEMKYIYGMSDLEIIQEFEKLHAI